ncbi:TetR/AcrR family transcriptional regulator [Yoonia sp. R2-816]|uniref:TetR/AcrR family transcriptional regulator n=1 Tax=Yoonia sp. R2-816 TaxID=3342638 RepID=UPI00372C1CDA
MTTKIGMAERLLCAAEEELVANGGHLEMLPVAKRAGVSVGSGYHHFGSKAGLLAAVAARFYGPLQEVTLGDAIPRDLPWAAREHRRLAAFVAYHLERRALAVLIYGGLSNAPEVLDLEREHMAAVVEAGARNLEQGGRAGVVRSTVPPRMLSALLMGAQRQAINTLIAGEGEIDANAAVRDIWSFVAAALDLGPAAHNHVTKGGTSHVG